MKINDILNESTEISPELIKERVQDLSSLLRKECSQVYKEFYSKPVDNFFSHSTDDKIKYVYRVVQNKTDRTPTDTPVYFHRLADEKLIELYNIPFRSNSLFTYYLPFNTSYYVVFPYDGYKMLSSPKIKDLFLNLRDMYPESPNVINAFHEFILKYSDFTKDDNISNLSILINNIFPLLAGKSWLKRDDFPNTNAFKEVFEEKFDRFYGGKDINIKAPIDAYEKLLSFLLDYANTELDTLVKSYTFITTPSDVESPRHEVMIHSNKFVIVNIVQILDYLVEKGHNVSVRELITMLYKNDLTLFEQ